MQADSLSAELPGNLFSFTAPFQWHRSHLSFFLLLLFLLLSYPVTLWSFCVLVIWNLLSKLHGYSVRIVPCVNVILICLLKEMSSTPSILPSWSPLTHLNINRFVSETMWNALMNNTSVLLMNTTFSLYWSLRLFGILSSVEDRDITTSWFPISWPFSVLIHNSTVCSSFPGFFLFTSCSLMQYVLSLSYLTTIPLLVVVQSLSHVWLFTRHGLQHASLPCPSLSPGVCLTHFHWVSDAIQLFRPPSSPSPPTFNFSQHQGIFNQFFKSGGQSIRASDSASVLPINIHNWFPLGLTGCISLQSKELSGVFSNTTVQKHQFFSAQLSLWSNYHNRTWLLEKPELWLDRSLSAKSLLFNTLSRFVIAFFQGASIFLFHGYSTICSDFWSPRK